VFSVLKFSFGSQLTAKMASSSGHQQHTSVTEHVGIGAKEHLDMGVSEPGAMYFKLSQGWSRWRVNRHVSVHIGLSEEQMHDRFGCPLQDVKIDIVVQREDELHTLLECDMTINCFRILQGHLTHTAKTSPCHDGRSRDLLNAALKLRGPAFSSKFLELVAQASHVNGGTFVAVFYCRHGRHRSVATATWFAILLTILGVDVTMMLPEERRCRCFVCNDANIEAASHALDGWTDAISEAACDYLRRGLAATEEVQRTLVDLIEFFDYCPIGVAQESPTGGATEHSIVRKEDL